MYDPTSHIAPGDLRLLGTSDRDMWQDCEQVKLTARHKAVVTPVYATYWRFASERQNVFMRRLLGGSRPWTRDTILSQHRFTNVYRAADRVSQFLIREVLYKGPQSPTEIVFRTLLFKFFNKISTWQGIVREVGMPSWSEFSVDRYERVLNFLYSSGSPIYSPAYIMPSPQMGRDRKHQNHLLLLEAMIKDGLPERIADAQSLKDVFLILVSYPSIGPFLAYQFAIDINYSAVTDFSEMEFVVPGPGARDGIRKCFISSGGLTESDLIRAVAELAESEFERFDLNFQDLWGRPLQLVDCQNLFCEVGKYSRAIHPNIVGLSNRKKIKQNFLPSNDLLPQWYPPKWQINDRIPPALQ